MVLVFLLNFQSLEGMEVNIAPTQELDFWNEQDKPPK